MGESKRTTPLIRGQVANSQTTPQRKGGTRTIISGGEPKHSVTQPGRGWKRISGYLIIILGEDAKEGHYPSLRSHPKARGKGGMATSLMQRRRWTSASVRREGHAAALRAT